MIYKRIKPAKISFKEFKEKYNDNRYLYCEALTGEWWYMDMETNEELPKFSKPIIRTTEEELMQKYEEFIECGLIEKVDDK